MNLKMPIVFDNDCVCSFSWINRLDIIDKLFAGNIVIPRVVLDEIKELQKYRFYRFVFLNIDQRIKKRQYEIKEIPELSPYKDEFSRLTERKSADSIGKGEAAAIVIAKMLNGTLASNNLKDVLPHIQQDQPPLITTETILYLAYQRKLISFQEGQQILDEMKLRKRKLSTYSFFELIEKYKETE
ncbi:putative nucleic acid-binding protein [Caldicellulosiruptor bescii]|uniref:PIN domain-containing protein n=2 Tax=Caldicellulosiruptor bescii TaxID=31899 RepID=B9MPU9_CALBD|nr:hypothetical protein [Caldicellulosiruptor bescii]ACM61732.1 conserved hypothetical protein [Caldicellulosiruptor bescii DSM 6725]PBC88467.1 putative nucleic acid-binding protein [Caldicellulosiruptor bescii]PBC92052.1 putative nucleic acid-binding protein [Caldicellulosiruptor bescii]PBD02535.1 putative nucleic acid-binding protein [Caldicellulosiruptor bescii]PBD05231.1 putative nucleic acid-binding protein [Caldicellulosiruptor bescii]